LYPSALRYFRHLTACAGTILVVCIGGCIKVACICADGNTLTLSDSFGILKGSVTSILGLRCFVCLDVDVLATNLGDVVSCGITGAGAGVTVGFVVVDMPTFDSCGCVNCDVLTATARGLCGCLEPFHHDGVGGYILVDGGGVSTGVTGVTSGVTGVPTCSIGFIICAAGVTSCVIGFIIGAAGVGAGFNGTTTGLPGINVGIADVVAGVTGVTAIVTDFGFGCLDAFGGGLAPGIYVDFGTGFGINCFRSGDNVSPGSMPGSLGGGGISGRRACCAGCSGTGAFGGGAENCCCFCCGAGLCATSGTGSCTACCRVGYCTDESGGSGAGVVVHRKSSPCSSDWFYSCFGTCPNLGKFRSNASFFLLSSYCFVCRANSCALC